MVKTVMQNADQQQPPQKHQPSSLFGLFIGSSTGDLLSQHGSGHSTGGSTEHHSLGAIPYSMSKASQSSNNSGSNVNNSQSNTIVSSLTNNRLYSVESIVKLTSSPISNNTSKSSSTTNLNLCASSHIINKIPHSSTANVTSFTQAILNSAAAASTGSSSFASNNGNGTSCLNNNPSSTLTGTTNHLQSHHPHHHHHQITNSHVSIITSAEQKKHLAKMSSAASSHTSTEIMQQQQQQQNNGTNNSTTDDTGGGSGSGGSKTPLKPKPMVATPQQVMALYMNKLTPYEHHEIYKYSEIYFIGANAKKRPGIIGPNNSDYDNEQGSYIQVRKTSLNIDVTTGENFNRKPILVQIPHDHIGYRYEVLKIIGKGSFGQVVKGKSFSLIHI